MMEKAVKQVVYISRTLLIVCGATAALAGCLLNSTPVPVVYGDGASYSPDKMPALKNGERVITVQRGDTVSGLSQRYSTNFQTFVARNELSAPYVIHPGQRLVLPPWEPASATATVQAPPQQTLATTNVTIAGRSEAVTTMSLDAPVSGNDVSTDAGPAHPVSAGKAEIPAPGMKPQEYAARAEQRFASANSWQTDRRSVAAPTPVASSTNSLKQDASLMTPAARAGFIWPVEGKIILGYGAGTGGLFNDGVNIAADRGTPIMAADNGIVTYVGNELRGFGNLILIKHEGEYVTAYAHTENPMVARGDVVKRGQKISTVGSTGAVSRPQLHFEIRHGRKSRDPMAHLPQLMAAR
ncbi:MAG: peptidoglycan DD-metalloendopeptidase family protein [Pseudomonadota bacterium]